MSQYLLKLYDKDNRLLTGWAGYDSAVEGRWIERGTTNNPTIISNIRLGIGDYLAELTECSDYGRNIVFVEPFRIHPLPKFNGPFIERERRGDKWFHIATFSVQGWVFGTVNFRDNKGNNFDLDLEGQHGQSLALYEIEKTFQVEYEYQGTTTVRAEFRIGDIILGDTIRFRQTDPIVKTFDLDAPNRAILATRTVNGIREPVYDIVYDNRIPDLLIINTIGSVGDYAEIIIGTSLGNKMIREPFGFHVFDLKDFCVDNVFRLEFIQVTAVLPGGVPSRDTEFIRDIRRLNICAGIERKLIINEGIKITQDACCVISLKKRKPLYIEEKIQITDKIKTTETTFIDIEEKIQATDGIRVSETRTKTLPVEEKIQATDRVRTNDTLVLSIEEKVEIAEEVNADKGRRGNIVEIHIEEKIQATDRVRTDDTLVLSIEECIEATDTARRDRVIKIAEEIKAEDTLTSERGEQEPPEPPEPPKKPEREQTYGLRIRKERLTRIDADGEEHVVYEKGYTEYLNEDYEPGDEWDDRFPFNRIKPCWVRDDGFVEAYFKPSDLRMVEFIPQRLQWMKELQNAINQLKWEEEALHDALLSASASEIQKIETLLEDNARQQSQHQTSLGVLAQSEQEDEPTYIEDMSPDNPYQRDYLHRTDGNIMVEFPNIWYNTFEDSHWVYVQISSIQKLPHWRATNSRTYTEKPEQGEYIDNNAVKIRSLRQELRELRRRIAEINAETDPDIIASLAEELAAHRERIEEIHEEIEVVRSTPKTFTVIHDTIYIGAFFSNKVTHAIDNQGYSHFNSNVLSSDYFRGIPGTGGTHINEETGQEIEIREDRTFDIVTREDIQSLGKHYDSFSFQNIIPLKILQIFRLCATEDLQVNIKTDDIRFVQKNIVGRSYDEENWTRFACLDYPFGFGIELDADDEANPELQWEMTKTIPGYRSGLIHMPAIYGGRYGIDNKGDYTTLETTDRPDLTNFIVRDGRLMRIRAYSWSIDNVVTPHILSAIQEYKSLSGWTKPSDIISETRLDPDADPLIVTPVSGDKDGFMSSFGHTMSQLTNGIQYLRTTSADARPLFDNNWEYHLLQRAVWWKPNEDYEIRVEIPEKIFVLPNNLATFNIVSNSIGYKQEIIVNDGAVFTQTRLGRPFTYSNVLRANISRTLGAGEHTIKVILYNTNDLVHEIKEYQVKIIELTWGTG